MNGLTGERDLREQDKVETNGAFTWEGQVEYWASHMGYIACFFFTCHTQPYLDSYLVSFSVDKTLTTNLF